MGLAQRKPKSYTPEEYLKLERASDTRHEYIDGEIFEMAGAGRQHNRISINLIHRLVTQTRDHNCSVYGSDMRVKVLAEEKYVYPDVVAICGDENYEDEREDNLLNPMVIFEVLSKSTEAYDRGVKFEAYQSVESLREYILVTQEPFRVEQFVRQDTNVWTYFEFRKAEDVVRLDSIGCELLLSDIYYKVQQKFPQEVA